VAKNPADPTWKKPYTYADVTPRPREANTFITMTDKRIGQLHFVGEDPEKSNAQTPEK
jgi:hypothetical protein